MISNRKIITDYSIYFLRKDFHIGVTYGKKGEVMVTHETLPVMGSGATLEEALAEFCDMFDIQYQGLVGADKSAKLTVSAKRTRDAFLQLVEDVFLIKERRLASSNYPPDDEITARVPSKVMRKVARKVKKTQRGST